MCYGEHVGELIENLMGISEEHIGNQGQMKKNPFTTQTSKERK
jgi:hypothetical protein